MAVKFVRIGPLWWVWLLASIAISGILLFLSPVCTFTPEGRNCTTIGMMLLRGIF